MEHQMLNFIHELPADRKPWEPDNVTRLLPRFWPFADSEDRGARQPATFFVFNLTIVTTWRGYVDGKMSAISAQWCHFTAYGYVLTNYHVSIDPICQRR